MNKSKNEFIIGITIIVALSILVIAILWGKQYSLTASKYKVSVRFGDIAGLEIGAPVLVNGIRKGKVLDFLLEQKGVIVSMNINEDVILYDDAIFDITSPDLMSGKIVNIFPGISGELSGSDFIFSGESGGGMNRLMKMSTILVEDVRHLTKVLEVTIENVNKTAGDPKLREALLSSIHNFDESTQRTLEIISHNEDKLTQVMDNLVSSTETIRLFVENNSGRLDDAFSNVNGFSITLYETGKRLEQLSQQIENGDGVLNLMIEDSSFAGSLEKTVNDLDSLILQIKEDGIQTNVSLFGRRK